MITIITNDNIKILVNDYVNSKTKLPQDLKSTPINSWDVTKVTNMKRLFQNYPKFNEPLNNWNVENVTNMEAMFYNCINFNQELSNWNVKNVTTMGGMFQNCRKFDKPLRTWNVQKVTNMAGMFYGCEKFSQPLGIWNVENVTNMSSMFYNCEKFNTDLSSWKVKKVINSKDMFTGCRILPRYKPKFINPVPQNASRIPFTFPPPRKVPETRSLTMITNDNIRKLVENYVNNKEQLPLDLQSKPINSWDVKLVTDMSNLFKDIIDFNEQLNDWDVSNVENMAYMFFGCVMFNQPLDKWNVQKVTDMRAMFLSCKKFNQPLNSWNVAKVENMVGMFYDCINFNQPLDQWNVSKVENMAHMFNDCKDFDQPLNSWNVAKVENMESMFFGCVMFNQPLDKWNVSNVKNMTEMFRSCLIFDQPLNNWNVAKVQQSEDIFTDADSMEEHKDNQPNFPKGIIIEPKQIDVVPIKIPENATAYDLLELDDVLIETFLQTKDNIIFIQDNKFYPFYRKQLQELLDLSKPNPVVVYICKQIYPVYAAFTSENLRSPTEYFNLSSIGAINGIVLASEIQYIVSDTENNVYVLKDTKDTAPSLISHSVFSTKGFGGQAVSGNHCQDSPKVPIYDIKIGKIETSNGGSNKKRKLTKKRNTQKSRHIKKRKTMRKRNNKMHTKKR